MRPTYPHRRAVASLFVALVAAAWSGKPLAQTTSDTPTPGTFYDVATIKPNKSDSGNVDVNQNRYRYDGRNVTLGVLLENAYGIRRDLIYGIPKDLEGQHYDVFAKISEPDAAAISHQTSAEIRGRMQPLLVERFHLKAHLETRTLPVFDLEIARGGPKLTADPPSKGTSEGVSQHNESMDVHGITLAHFGEAIMPYAGRPVLDKTALPGRFSFSLHWASDHDPTQPNGPTLFTAVQEQLGLKLMPSKGAVTVLVVDHADAPTPD